MKWINKVWWGSKLRELVIILIILMLSFFSYYYVSGIDIDMRGQLAMYQNLLPNVFFSIINAANIFLVIALRVRVEPFLLARLEHKTDWLIMNNVAVFISSALTSFVVTIGLFVAMQMMQGTTDIEPPWVLGGFWFVFQALVMCQTIILLMVTCFPLLNFTMASCLVGVVLFIGSLRSFSAIPINEITLINEILAKQSLVIIISKSLIMWGIIFAIMSLAQLRARKREYL